MRWIAMATLLLFTLAFDVCMLWMLDFTWSWSEGLAHGAEWIGLGLTVASCVLVTSFCVIKLRAFRNDHVPRF
jgi:hypothetical protein